MITGDAEAGHINTTSKATSMQITAGTVQLPPKHILLSLVPLVLFGHAESTISLDGADSREMVRLFIQLSRPTFYITGQYLHIAIIVYLQLVRCTTSSYDVCQEY